MESLLYVMAILGCGEGDAACEEVRLAPSRFESESAGLAATGAELLRNRNLLYPVVVAQCRPAHERLQVLRGRHHRAQDRRGPPNPSGPNRRPGPVGAETTGTGFVAEG